MLIIINEITVIIFAINGEKLSNIISSISENNNNEQAIPFVKRCVCQNSRNLNDFVEFWVNTAFHNTGEPSARSIKSGR